MGLTFSNGRKLAVIRMPWTAFSLAILEQHKAVWFISGNFFKGLIACLPIVKIEVREETFSSSVDWCFPESDDSIRFRNCWRCQDESIDDTEDRGVRTDTEREGKDDNGSKRTLSQKTSGTDSEDPSAVYPSTTSNDQLRHSDTRVTSTHAGKVSRARGRRVFAIRATAG